MVNKGSSRLKLPVHEIIVLILFLVFLCSLFVPKWIKQAKNAKLENGTKKFYTELTDGMQKYMEKKHYRDLRRTPMTWDRDGKNTSRTREDAVNTFNEFITDTFKVRRKCKVEKNNNCFAKIYKTIRGKKKGPGIAEQPSFLLSNGGAIQMLYPPTKESPGLIVFDINGKKGPNTGGRDIWSISLFWDGTMDESYFVPDNIHKSDFNPSIANDQRFTWHCTSSAYDGGGCFGHFKEKDFKFDY